MIVLKFSLPPPIRRWMRPGFAGLLFLIAALRLDAAGPELDARALSAVDLAVSNAVASGRVPGAVVWVERHGESHHRALGRRALVPAPEPMSDDTVFDAASLTKVVATAPAVLRLVEQGRVDLEAPVSRYLPEFTGGGREAITVRQLLTHVSGLPPGLPRGEPWTGRSQALALAVSEPLSEAPGTRFRYSDINFILLGFVVEAVSGEPLDAFCDREIFRPLGMRSTGFRPFVPTGPLDLPAMPPTPEAVASIAPTEVLTNGWVLLGVVHDPTARRLGGVAGHAGLFTTAPDLARFCRLFLNGGSLEGVTVLSPATVRQMTSVQSPPGLPRRGLGWDLDSPYAGQRGSLFPLGGFGHTGWTGTSVWVDPFSETFVLLLSNRNHPTEDGSVLALRREVGTLAARAVRGFDFASVKGALPAQGETTARPSTPAVASAALPAVPAPARAAAAKGTSAALNGVDALADSDFAALRGLKVGLITNQTGRDRHGRSTVDLLRAAPGVTLVALFSPEHGIRGVLDQEAIGDGTDAQTGLPVYSLYGERRAPTPGQLAGLDALVFDIQDIGCRFYTYISTMGLCLEAAGRAGRRFIILDRVNPIGSTVEGPVAAGERSFVAWHEIPLRHGMTVGELARLFNAERGFGADLTVIPVRDWTPGQWFDQTGLPWVNPSPNMRSLTAATLYPGVGLLEFCRVSVGRGTATPFELLGAPYVDETALTGELNRAGLEGVRFEPVRFTPDASVFAGQECRGVRLVLTDRDRFRSADLGVTLATVLHRRHPEQLQLDKMQRLLGSLPVLDAIRAGQSPAVIRGLWQADLARFEERCRPHLLYPR
ncbi:MAG: DUF1343 domain-containing protein [Verrucomicrobia bacterium]|nr:DUF1343 domain-containing protein [Verrucomicrobiota bacterium]